MKTKILVATHKLESVIDNDIFRPIQVGCALNNYSINSTYLKDDVAENISDKNSTFNELTAIYWVWKNKGEEDVFGLMHYRRFLNIFYRKPFFRKDRKKALICVRSDDKKLLKLNDVQKTETQIAALLEHCDVITANPVFCSHHKNFISIAEDYKKNHIAEDWDLCMEVVQELFPEYKTSIETYLYQNNTFYIGNMFIAKKEWLDGFCHWLFAILFEVEKRITLSEDPYQKRVIGFLSERLFTLYILHHGFQIKSFPIFYVED